VPKLPGGEVCVWNLGTKIESTNHQQERKNTKMRNKIINYIRAGYPGLYLVSHEEQRVALEMTRIAQELKYNLVFWSVVHGLVDTQKGTNNSANDPLEALIAIKDLKEKTLIPLRDFHLFLQDPNPALVYQNFGIGGRGFVFDC
jgi:endo-alpha-1,4-polygalactosaminidase (GH114 family)